eukprot:2785477-Amphidinium_carterae.1
MWEKKGEGEWQERERLPTTMDAISPADAMLPPINQGPPPHIFPHQIDVIDETVNVIVDPRKHRGGNVSITLAGA